MCGRYTLTVSPDKIRALAKLHTALNTRPLFNVAPTQMVPVVRVRDGERHMDVLRWGLIPAWSRDAAVASKLINARGETLAEKSSFKAAYLSRRCLVPADGFYEWRSEGGSKQPFRIGFRGGKPFMFAGLWESWRPAAKTSTAENVIETFTIVTTQANTKLAKIHHRMPVIVDPSEFDLWLNGTPGTVSPVIRPYPQESMVYYRVSTRVNNVRNDDPECVAPLKRTP